MVDDKNTSQATLRQAVGVKLVVLVGMGVFTRARTCLSIHLVLLLFEFVIRKARRKDLSGNTWGALQRASKAISALSTDRGWLRAICEILPEVTISRN